MTFSWRDLDNASSKVVRPSVPPGRYATDVINQHSKGWCGACYLVCAVQCIDDRGYIASVRSAGGRKVARRTVSLQSVMDHYQVYQGSKEEDGWNGCHGGWSSEVFQCFVDKECPLAFEAGGGAFSWSGFVRSVRSMVSPTVGYQVVSHSVLPPNEVPHRLVAEGPVVLEISADVCLSLDERGVCTDLTPRSPDHAVCVVGWKEVDGVGTCWICRNSWGKERVPENLPDNYSTCVGIDRNDCDITTKPWKGMPSDPGFFLLPFAYPPLMNTHSSPWMAPLVRGG